MFLKNPISGASRPDSSMRIAAAMAFIVGSVFSALAIPQKGESPETPLSLGDLPPMAQKAVVKYSDGLLLISAEKAEEDGLPVYEIKLAPGVGQTATGEIQTTLDGEMLMREEKISTGSLPKAVLAQIRAQHPNMRIVEAEATLRLVYEVELESRNPRNRGTKELLFNAGGQPVGGVKESPRKTRSKKARADRDED